MSFREHPERSQTPTQDTIGPHTRYEPIDPNVVRYSLSDAPQPPRHDDESYDAISQAVDHLLQDVSSSPHGHGYRAQHAEGHPWDASPQQVQRYQPGQYLETIMTGETLEIPDTRPATTDPFTNAQLSYTPVPRDSYYDQEDYVPPSNASYMSYDDDDSYNTAEEPIDHQQYDADTYASGIYSRQSVPPRSRSPTPAVDDEDYQLSADNHVRITGYSNSSYSSYDPEKGGMDHGNNGFNPYYTSPHSYYPDEKMSSHNSESDVESTRHFGPAPVGPIVRRQKSKKRRVKLTNGNIVIDIPVPPKLVLPRRGSPETLSARYTAVTCDPDDFQEQGYTLRQQLYKRTTELFIVITLYNEDEVLFCRTLYGVMRNISHLCTRKNSRTWGQNAWQKVVVCIVADGRRKVHPRVLDCLTLLGVYQPGPHIKNSFEDKPITAHLFEYTTSFGLDSNLHFKYPDKGIVPTQIIFCMKENNQKKINSHRWFFNAFGPLLNPNVCVLLDVGTRPGNKSIYKLWKTFDLNSNVGGACGEISVFKGKRWSALLNPLVAAQNFEYKISCILDKTTESMFGFISVLPGAFSAYRYIALQNDSNGVGPLASYFKGEVLHGHDTDIFTSNMYLAEDRILCFELVAKKNCNWILRYVKGANGETDVPDGLPEFIAQRRRWLNGSFFAATYAIAHVGQILRSGHSFARKIMLMIETVYNIINIIFSWFAIGNFYLFFVVLTTSLEDPVFNLNGIQYVNTIVQYLFASSIAACFLFSMGNRPKAAKFKYKFVSIFMAVIMMYLIAASITVSIHAARQGGTANSVMLFSVVITYGLYAASSILAFDPWHMITSFLPYMLLSPTYINILNIYAFTNLDDISWGTKQDDTPEIDLGAVVRTGYAQVDVDMLTEAADVDSLYEEALLNLKHRKPVDQKTKGPSVTEQEQNAKDYYANVRTNVLLAWALSNGLLLLAIFGQSGNTSGMFQQHSHASRAKSYLIFILTFTALSTSIRWIGSTLYLLMRLITGDQ